MEDRGIPRKLNGREFQEFLRELARTGKSRIAIPEPTHPIIRSDSDPAHKPPVRFQENFGH